MQIERNPGADVIMQFDHVIPGQSDESSAREASERSIRWLKRCLDEVERVEQTQPLEDSPPSKIPPDTSPNDRIPLPGSRFPRQALFPIVQGGIHSHLRRE